MQSNRGNNDDDVSSLGQVSTQAGTNNRHVYQLVQMPTTLPPAPNGNTPPQIPNQDPNQTNNEGSIRSSNAGNAFGR